MKLQEFRRFNEAQLVQPTRTKLVLPGFTLPIPTWEDASLLLAEYPVGNAYNFSIKLPIEPFGENFVAAIRWVEDEIVSRFVLFEHEDMVLFYPTYQGEVIGAEAVLEIWSVNSEEAPTSPVKIFESSVLVFPSECGVCCEIPAASYSLSPRQPTIINPYSYCSPFCLPLEV